MKRLADQSINQLPMLLPENVVAPSDWLVAQGFSRQSLNKYKNKWLEQPVKGVYVRYQSPVTWEGALLGLQRLAKLPFHIGGVTALNQQGFAHYLPFNGDNIQLWGGGTLPTWVHKLPMTQQWEYHTRQLFGQTDSLPGKTLGIVQLPTKIRDWEINVSSVERAILEVLSIVGTDEASFIFAAELFEGLTTLRPKLLNQLLQCCTHIKTKRLFLFLAHYFNYPWLARLDWQALDLGSGKRSIVKGGKLDKQFNITVPEAYHVKQG